MSRKVLAQKHTVPGGPDYGRVLRAADIVTLQTFASDHVEDNVRDFLMAGAPGARVSGFGQALTGGLGLSIAAGRAVDANGISYDVYPDGAATAILLANANAALPRIDLIVVALASDQDAEQALLPHRRLLSPAEELAGVEADTQNFNVFTERRDVASVVVRQGVAAAVPVAPAAAANEVALYQVRVEASAVALTADKVTDLRPLIRSLYNAWSQIDALNAAPAIANFAEAVDDRVAALLVDSTFFTKVYNDAGNLLTLDADLAAFDGRYVQLSALNESVDDRVAALIVDSTFFTKVYDDAGNLLTLDADLAAFDARYALSANLNESIDDRVNALLAMGSAFLTKTYDDAGNILTLDVSLAQFDARYVNATGNDGIAGNFTVAGNLTMPADGIFHSIDHNLDRVGFVKPVGSMGRLAFAGGAGGGFNMLIVSKAATATINPSDAGQSFTEVARFTTTGFAVTGSMSCTGALSKGSGTFWIDHPLFPAELDLVHGFVESDEYMLIYRVRAKLTKGRAVVDMDAVKHLRPGTFAALWADAEAIVLKRGRDHVEVAEIVGGKFELVSDNAADESTVTCLVMAARHDPLIRSHEWSDSEGRLICEQPKREPTPEQLALLDPITIVQEGEEDAPDTQQVNVVDALIGLKGFPRLPEFYGREHPKQVITIRHVQRPQAEGA